MKEKMNQTERFFRENVDWPLLYEEKMAVCELIDILSEESEDIKKKNAINWLVGLLNMMDEMGDIAESLGLFEYPERDSETDRCFDERFNDVLMRDPDEEVSE